MYPPKARISRKEYTKRRDLNLIEPVVTNSEPPPRIASSGAAHESQPAQRVLGPLLHPGLRRHPGARPAALLLSRLRPRQGDTIQTLLDYRQHL